MWTATQDTAVLFPCISGEEEQVWSHHRETAQANGTACLLEGAEDVLLWGSSGKMSYVVYHVHAELMISSEKLSLNYTNCVLVWLKLILNTFYLFYK